VQRVGWRGDPASQLYRGPFRPRVQRARLQDRSSRGHAGPDWSRGACAGYDRRDADARDEREALPFQRERRGVNRRHLAGEEGHDEGGGVLREGARDAARAPAGERDGAEVEARAVIARYGPRAQRICTTNLIGVIVNTSGVRRIAIVT